MVALFLAHMFPVFLFSDNYEILIHVTLIPLLIIHFPSYQKSY